MIANNEPSSAEWVYIALDGDNVGRRLEQLITAESEEEIRSFAESIAERLQVLARRIVEHGGRVIFSSGDGLLACVPRMIALTIGEEITRPSDSVRFSGGIGRNMTQAMLSLNYAKASGRNRIVAWESIAGQPDSAKVAE
jgi:hypothetical protein